MSDPVFHPLIQLKQLGSFLCRPQIKKKKKKVYSTDIEFVILIEVF